MSPRIAAALAALGLALALALAAGGEARSDEGKPVRLFAKVKSIAADGAIEVGTRAAGNCKLEMPSGTALVLADGVSIQKLGGMTAKVLCKYNEAYTDPSNGVRYPPTYAQILAVVTGDGFTAPSDTTGVPAGVKWYGGEMRCEGEKGSSFLGGVLLQTGGGRTAWSITKAPPAELKKDAGLIVEGELRKEGKVKVLTATRVAIIGRSAPANEVNLVFGPVS